MKFSLRQHKASSRPSLSGGLGHQIATDPFLDWILILACSAGVALILVGVGVSVYLDSRDRLEAPVTVPLRSQALPLDEAALSKALKSFDDRADARSRVLHGFTVPRDPALP
jgi:hypothetical protein